VALLADRTSASGDPRDAMCIVTDGRVRHVSSTLLALPPYANQRPAWFFADGRPGEAAWERVEPGGGA
jgi:hypothetical protein